MFSVTTTMKYMFNAHAEVVNLHGDTFCLFVSAWNANMSIGLSYSEMIHPN